MDEINHDTVIGVLNSLTNDTLQFTSDFKDKIRDGRVANERTFQANLHTLLIQEIRGIMR